MHAALDEVLDAPVLDLEEELALRGPPGPQVDVAVGREHRLLAVRDLVLDADVDVVDKPRVQLEQEGQEAAAVRTRNEDRAEERAEEQLVQRLCCLVVEVD